MSDTKDFLSVSETEFEQFQRRAFTYEHLGFPKADPECIPLIQALNRTKDIAPVFSCAGHLKNDQSERFYLMMVCLPSGRKRLEKLFVKMVSGLAVNDLNKLSLTYKQMFSLFTEISLEEQKFTYPAVFIEFRFTTPRQQASFLSILSAQLNSLSTDYA